MTEPWTRKRIFELGLVATQAGVESPEQLMDLIRIGNIAPYRTELALSFMGDAQTLLKGVTA